MMSASDTSARSTARLREFQARLAQRLKDAQDAQPVRGRLGLEIAGQYWLLELTQTGEVVPVPAIRRVPLARDWLLGLVNIRGSLHPVVDLALFMGRGPTPMTKQSRLVLMGPRTGCNTALLVTRMIGLRRTEDMQSGERAPGAPDWVGRTWSDAEGRNWLELDLSVLAHDEQFLRAGR
jgi:twitching motility protein PilI